MGKDYYFSLLQHSDGVIGNSSSGVIEAPSFSKGSINIGNRQKGRLKANSIIDSEFNSNQIKKSINKLVSKDFQLSLKNIYNPYGSWGASKKIIQILEKINFNELINKSFFNINY